MAIPRWTPAQTISPREQRPDELLFLNHVGPLDFLIDQPLLQALGADHLVRQLLVQLDRLGVPGWRGRSPRSVAGS